MKVCTKKIRPLARSTNHHYQRYLFSVYEQKTGKQYVIVRLFVYPKHKQSMEMPQGGTTVDIMKIDHCEGCEWEQFHDWFDDWKEMNLTVRILLLLRCIAKKSPLLQTPDFFAKMCCWEVGLFHFYHKEANTLNTHYL